MTTTAHPVVPEHRVNFGYQWLMFFGPSPRLRRLPTAPPPARPAERCDCPHCVSSGWYAQSPACRRWRADCARCHGARFYWAPLHRTAARRCEHCQHTWTRELKWFRFALKFPRMAERIVRDDVRTHTATDERPPA